MVIITHVGGEGADLPTDFSEITYTGNSKEYPDLAEGEHYLQPSQTELNMLYLVCSQFEDVVLVYNGANAMELDFVNEYSQIKSVLRCPGARQTGFDAWGKIVSGEVNPSGKAPDTF